MTRLPLAPYQVRAALEKRLSIVTANFKVQPEDVNLVEIVNNGVVKYRRPIGHSMIEEARNTPGYSVRTVLEGIVEDRSPFPAPGKTFVGTETFARYQTINHVRRMDGRSFSEVSDGCIAYKEDGYGTIPDLKIDIRLTSESDFEGVEVEFDRWQSPAVMKAREARFLFTVVRRGVWRLGDISPLVAVEKMGLQEGWEPGMFIDHWQFYAEVSVEVRK